ncbi:hypothetical protein BV509_09440 [Rhodovulum sulfidophilum]|uniref:Excalibur calcium-binding domain-containing protein n=1 Tax=Rhodovulum visakhapatnamense TaxID=364297 RepID=A0ABS1RER5_9RHOB|nr:hypothetical protein [Rhodovulum visakhapatnamense]MBL3570489.1 hypothetical protein [Rhodovulum visakhapatnamense]MBL3578030.1 hypothetical protein [Rhodovulum visakhapatnamense]OLS44541.1 hypothetical protein BV509_09440 [Rhodovulum sulfidophilum]
MRAVTSAIALLALAACNTQLPDSAAGVGFDNYADYSAHREGVLQGTVSAQPLDAAPAQGVVTEITGGPISAVESSDAAVTPGVQAENHAGISDEQSFAAVSARESIASDRQRLEQQREQYTFIPPEPLPPRPGGDGAGIIEYALSTTNPLGQPVYKRGRAVAPETLARRCAKYGSDDHAQEAFLKNGGPERDRLGIDPDGDGFACYWDPSPFRLAER